LAIVGLLVAIPCNFKYGLVLWDRWDFYINNWGLLIIAFLEVLSVSFFFKREDRVKSAGSLSCLIVDSGLIIGMIISAFVFV